MGFLSGQVDSETILKEWQKLNIATVYKPGALPDLRKSVTVNLSRISEKFKKASDSFVVIGLNDTDKKHTLTWLSSKTSKTLIGVNSLKLRNKYIGETEKNLDYLFRAAREKGWILFFDEADALFGKRTEVKDSHDRYANQEVSYLIERSSRMNVPVIISLPKANPVWKRKYQNRLMFIKG